MKKSLIFLMALLIPGLFYAQSSIVAQEYYKMDKIKTIHAELSYESIRVEQIYGDEVTVEISSNNSRKIPDFDVENGELYIHSVRRYALGDRCIVYLYIPQDMKCESIDFSLASGDIIIRDLSAENISLQSASGDIHCESINAENEFSARALSGDVIIKRIDAGKISTKATSGDIEIVTINADEVTAATASGDIDISQAGTEYLSCSSASGSIACVKTTCDFFDLRSASGNIALKLTKQPEAESSITTTSGDVRLILPKTSQFEINASSNSGIFEDDFRGRNVKPRGKYVSKYNGGGALINIQTRSGNINLDD